jgi:amino acid transporter
MIYKYFRKTKIMSLESIPLLDALEQAELYPEEPEKKQSGWLRFVSWIWE